MLTTGKQRFALWRLNRAVGDILSEIILHLPEETVQPVVWFDVDLILLYLPSGDCTNGSGGIIRESARRRDCERVLFDRGSLTSSIRNACVLPYSRG